jgi:hypothetical protein
LVLLSLAVNPYTSNFSTQGITLGYERGTNMGDMSMAVEVMSTAPMKAVMRKHNKDAGNYFSVAPYVNGREAGFCVADNRDWEKSGGRAVAFSENRNSDSLVIYVGKDYMWEHEREHAKKEKRDISLNFELTNDVVKLTDEIYYKHSYHVWCNRPSLFKKVGKAIALFLDGFYTEKEFAKAIKDVEAEGKKILGF